MQVFLCQGPSSALEGTILTASIFFLTSDIGTATAALNLVNGYLFKGKPVIIQYGKQKKDFTDKNSANVNTQVTPGT